MDKSKASTRLFVFGILVIGGLTLGSLASVIPAFMQGLSMESIQEDPGSLLQKLNAGNLRLSLFINHLFLFLLPSVIYGLYIFKKDFFQGLDLHKKPAILSISFGLLLILFAYPLVTLAHYINSILPLADWMIQAEQDVSATLKKILEGNNSFMILVNVLLIALMPAIGEELVFRAILQKNIAKIFKNGHVGVWIAAILFSLIHFQFEGFLARMMLGAIMGYGYYFTRNLWVPITMHFVNNFIPVVAFMVAGEDLTDTSQLENGVEWWTILVSILGVPALIYIYKKYNGGKETIRT